MWRFLSLGLRPNSLRPPMAVSPTVLWLKVDFVLSAA